MQDPYAETFQRRKFFVDQDPTRRLQHILPNACRRFTEGHSDFFATQPTQRTPCKTRSSPHTHDLSVSERIPDQRLGPEEECRQSELAGACSIAKLSSHPHSA